MLAVLPNANSAHWVPAADEQSPLLMISVGALLDATAEKVPGREALVTIPEAGHPHERRWMYPELRERSRAVARALIASGIGKGDRVATWTTNVSEWFLLQFGAAYAGAILVPINPLFRTAEVRYVLQRSRARALFVIPEDRGQSLWALAAEAATDAAELDLRVPIGDSPEPGFPSWDEWVAGGSSVSEATLEDRAQEVAPDDFAQILFTSGTTGSPKGAMLRHAATINNARLFAVRGDVPEQARICTGLPMFHCGGSVLSSLCSVVMASTFFPLVTFSARRAIDTIDREAVDVFTSVPAMQVAMDEELRHGGSLKSLRRVLTGGAPVPPELVRGWKERFGAATSVTYGLTEASPIVTQTSIHDDPERHEGFSVGQAIPHVEVDIADPRTQERLGVGEQGEVRTRGWMVMGGYFEDPVATDAAITADGWLRTGDLGTLDRDGFLRITGRAKGVVIRGGENIYPAEIEQQLRQLEGVVAASVVGVPDPRYGEVCAAFLLMRDGTTMEAEEVKRDLAGRLARFKIPQYVLFVEEFPMTPSGKIQKFKLRERYLAGGYGGTAGSNPTPPSGDPVPRREP